MATNTNTDTDTDWIHLTFKVEQLFGTSGLVQLMELPVLQFNDKNREAVTSSSRDFIVSNKRPGAGIFCDLVVEKFKKMGDRDVKAMIKDPSFSVPFGVVFVVMTTLIVIDPRWAYVFGLVISSIMQILAYEIGKMRQSTKYLSSVSHNLKESCKKLLENPPKCSICGSPAVRKCSICETLSSQSNSFLCGGNCAEIHAWTACGKQGDTVSIAEA